MRATTLDAYNLLHRGSEALGRAERQGMRIDVDYCKRMTKRLTYRIEKASTKFDESDLGRKWRRRYGGNYNANSDQQLRHMLYDQLGLQPYKLTNSGEGSTDEESLLSLGIPEIRYLLKRRKLTKTRDTYLGSFIREQRFGEIHPFFHLHSVHSYRSSSADPNFQNIPEHDKEAKRLCQRAVYPRKGHKIKKADFGMLEVCISACYNKDPKLIEYINDPSSDMHGDSAKDLFLLDSLDKSIPEDKWLRFCAKNSFVFAEFYGSYYEDCAVNLANQISMPSEGTWRSGQGVMLPGEYHISDHMRSKGITSFSKFEDRVKEAERVLWEDRFPVYADWRKRWFKQYEKRGYFDLLTGFRCSGVYGRNQTFNLPVQGAAFHCLLWAFIRVDEIMREEGWDTKLIGEVHDDMMLDVHPDEEEHVDATIHRVVSEELPKAWPWIIVPLRIEINTGPVDGSLYTVGDG